MSMTSTSFCEEAAICHSCNVHSQPVVIIIVKYMMAYEAAGAMFLGRKMRYIRGASFH